MHGTDRTAVVFFELGGRKFQGSWSLSVLSYAVRQFMLAVRRPEILE